MLSNLCNAVPIDGSIFLEWGHHRGDQASERRFNLGRLHMRAGHGDNPIVTKGLLVQTSGMPRMLSALTLQNVAPFSRPPSQFPVADSLENVNLLERYVMIENSLKPVHSWSHT